MIDTNDYDYIYDNIGNILYTSLNAITNAYTVNNLNQYKAITNLVDLSGYRLQFDADGNMVRLDDHIPAYDAENRLATYTFGIGSETGMLRSAYVYDHYGRRVKRMGQISTQKNPGGILPLTYWHTNEVTTFVYDGWNLIHERVAHTNGTVDEIEYAWGLDLSGTLQGAGGVGGLLFEKRNGAIYVPCYDANGNITSYVDTNGSVRAYRQFDAFGNTVSKGGDMVDVFHFWYSTKYFDHDTDLYYYGYRYYSPLLQRWINRDPIEEDGGVNLYGFVKNRALNRIDKLGLFSLLWREPSGDEWQSINRNSRLIANKAIEISDQIALFFGDDGVFIPFLREHQVRHVDVVIQGDLSKLGLSNSLIEIFELNTLGRPSELIRALYIIKVKLGKIARIEDFKRWKVSKCDTGVLRGLYNRLSGNIGLNKELFKIGHDSILRDIMAHEFSHQAAGTRDFFVEISNKADRYGVLLQ